MSQELLNDQQWAQVEHSGLCVESVKKLLVRASQEVREGLLPAAQVAMARHGKLVFQANFGAAQPSSLTCIFSATKAVTASAAWLLMQDGLLDESERVVDIIPEFDTNNKDTVTVSQLFSHTAGFPHAPFAPLQWDDKEARYDRFRQWRLTWPAGSRYEYHASSSMWVIAELIERRSGLGYREFMRQRVIEPLGLTDLYVGLPAEQNARVLPSSYVGDALSADDYQQMGLPVPPVTEVTETAVLNFNKPEVRAVGVPGGGAYATAAAVTAFYQALLSGGTGNLRLWREQTLASARRVRTGEFTDAMYKKLANRSLGLMISGDESRNFRSFGKTNSPEAFGHSGAGGQIAWAEPGSGISFCYLTPAHDRNGIRQGRRGVAISSLAAVCAE